MKHISEGALAEAIEARVSRDLLSCNIGGASALVKQGDRILYKKHFGSDFCEVSDRTLFRLASMTKPISAVGAMILVERGLLSLDDTVDRFYSGFSTALVLNEKGEREERAIDTRVNVRHLLTHTSGIASGVMDGRVERALTDSDRASVDGFVEFLSRMPLSFVPGTMTEYSGVGAFSVLTGIIQKVSGMPYSEFLKKEIFEPCGMVDTTFAPSEEQWGRLIPMHNKKDGVCALGETREGCVFSAYPVTNFLGGAGLVSSMSDYLQFAQMLMARGLSEGGRILTESSVEAIATPLFPKGDGESWGLGVRVITEGGKSPLPIGTYGWSGAYGTHFFIDRANEVIGIYMKNSRYDGGANAVTAANFERDVYSALV